MKKNIPISKIMTRELVTLDISDDLYKAERLFKENKIRHLPVVKDRKLVGILSYTDLLRLCYVDIVASADDTLETFMYDHFTVSQIMMHKLVVVSPKTTLKEVCELLSVREFHALPVVENGKLKGIVTTTDIIKYFLETCLKYRSECNV
ncbi:MAG: CBS domain-containing protein [Bacteroidetes bacterium]|nr:CBS domain-containing protein [Bacteroidota bacterium]